MRQEWTPALKTAFLDHLIATGSVRTAAQFAGVSRTHAYRLRAEDAEFASRWAEAEHDAQDALLREARRRAVEGLDRPLLRGGVPVTNPDGSRVMIRSMSDQMLMFLIRMKIKDREQRRKREAGI